MLSVGDLIKSHALQCHLNADNAKLPLPQNCFSRTRVSHLQLPLCYFCLDALFLCVPKTRLLVNLLVLSGPHRWHSYEGTWPWAEKGSPPLFYLQGKFRQNKQKELEDMIDNRPLMILDNRPLRIRSEGKRFNSIFEMNRFSMKDFMVAFSNRNFMWKVCLNNVKANG